MRYALARWRTGIGAALTRRRVLVAFDFDGTLAPITGNRRGAGMRTRTLQLLAAVCRRYPCAVISGRGRADVVRRLGGVAVKYVIGNHGLEPGRGTARFARLTRAARRQLGRALAAVPGIEIEDKRYSLAIHYRRARARVTARRAIHRAVAKLSVPVRIIPGKRVVNVVPEGATDKGGAVRGLRARERAAAVIYAGDDITDEDVFALDARSWLIPVRVGRSTRSAARYYLRDQGEIDLLLARLVEAADD